MLMDEDLKGMIRMSLLEGALDPDVDWKGQKVRQLDLDVVAGRGLKGTLDPNVD